MSNAGILAARPKRLCALRLKNERCEVLLYELRSLAHRWVTAHAAAATEREVLRRSELLGVQLRLAGIRCGHDHANRRGAGWAAGDREAQLISSREL